MGAGVCPTLSHLVVVHQRSRLSFTSKVSQTRNATSGNRALRAAQLELLLWWVVSLGSTWYFVVFFLFLQSKIMPPRRRNSSCDSARATTC